MQPALPVGDGPAGRPPPDGDIWDRALALFQARTGLPLLLLLALVTGAILWYMQRQAFALYHTLAVQGAALQAETVFDMSGSSGEAPATAALVRQIERRLERDRPGAHVRLLGGAEAPAEPDAFERQALEVLRADPGRPFYRFEDYEGRP
jgi:hypothetical protein